MEILYGISEIEQQDFLTRTKRTSFCGWKSAWNNIGRSFLLIGCLKRSIDDVASCEELLEGGEKLRSERRRGKPYPDGNTMSSGREFSSINSPKIIKCNDNKVSGNYLNYLGYFPSLCVRSASALLTRWSCSSWNHRDTTESPNPTPTTSNPAPRNPRNSSPPQATCPSPHNHGTSLKRTRDVIYLLFWIMESDIWS